MARKIASGVLIGLASLLLLASIAGIIAAWAYNKPLTEDGTTRLAEVDATLAQIRADLSAARDEVDRALRILDSAEAALASLTEQTSDATSLLENVSATLDDQLIPGLKSTREDITQVRAALEDLRVSLEQLNSIPFVELNIPGDDLLASLLGGLDSLDAEAANVEDLATRVSTFVSDTSYLMGGDFSETRANLETLLDTLREYDAQITDWRAQVAAVTESLPGWIDNASIGLTLFLLWFGLSQFGLLLHGLSLWRGENPLEALRALRAKRQPDASAGKGKAASKSA
jgi:chromosome segregation ATPase